MSFDLTTTSNKAGGYMKTYLDATAAGAASLLPAMKAMAKGVLQALSEDEDGFNQNPGTAGTVSGGLVGTFVKGTCSLDVGQSSVNAVSGTINFSFTFANAPAVVANGIDSSKIQVHSTGVSSWVWKTSDGSTFNGVIHWIAAG